VVLGSGFLCRQLWGWFSDRTGGLVTLSVCSATQATALTAFLMTQTEIGLFTVSAFFGLGFSGLVPAYVLALREFFPVKDAQWRVPTLLLFSGSGMAAGAWIGGALYDLSGYYGPAFFCAIAANVLNLIIVVALLLRQRSHLRSRSRNDFGPHHHFLGDADQRPVDRGLTPLTLPRRQPLNLVARDCLPDIITVISLPAVRAAVGQTRGSIASLRHVDHFR